MPCCSWKNRRKPWQHWDLWLPVIPITTPQPPYLNYDAGICVFTCLCRPQCQRAVCDLPTLKTVASITELGLRVNLEVLAASTFVPWESWTKLSCWRDHILGKILQLRGEGSQQPSSRPSRRERRHISNHQQEQQEKLPHWTSTQITEKWERIE